MKSIFIFTKNGCPQCRELKQRLNNLSIPFKDIEVTLNRDLWNQVVTQTGYDVLPTVFIKDDNGSSGLVYTPGRDFQDIDEIIEILKKEYIEKRG
jgi:glutaredoxin 3